MAKFSTLIKFNLTRKDFIIRAAQFFGLSILGLSAYSFFSTKKTTKPIPGKIIGASHTIGHKLRGGNLPTPTKTTTIDTLIIGSGISGLSAGRILKRNNQTSYKILELENHIGGNSSFGKNDTSSYPWGAHYLPIPNQANTALLEFLKENNVIEGEKDNLPVYNELYLCHDPEERLFINGHWQEGLIPTFGVPKEDTQQFKAFDKLMHEFKIAKGKDQKEAFTIPLDNSSSDEAFRKYDSTNFKGYLISKGFTSTYLHWYVDYCCRDDYGTTANETSAWAGIHYFASRKGIAYNADANDVLTWPSGNGWLSNCLQNENKGHIETGTLAYKVNIEGANVIIDTYSIITHQTERIIAKNCILATPQFINKNIIAKDILPSTNYNAFSYAPWMVANLKIKDFLTKKGAPLSWDNVFYNRTSLGYINANHQDLGLFNKEKMITFYMPLTNQSPVASRETAIKKTHEQWVEEIISELKPAHNDIEDKLLLADVCIWGHGMIRPTPGFIWGEERKKAKQPIDNKIFFAHSDLCGISIFEEAFYQGIHAANAVLEKANV